MGEFKAIPTKIGSSRNTSALYLAKVCSETQKSRLEAIQRDLAASGNQIQEHNKKQDEIAMARAQKALDYADAVDKLRATHSELHDVELMLIEATSDVATLTERNQEVKNLIDSKEKELEQLENQVKEHKTNAEKFLKEVQRNLRKDAEEGDTLRAFMQALPQGQTIEEFDSEIESEKARLELMAEGNGNTIREYETRKGKIESLVSKVAQEKEALDEIDAEITKRKEKWEPELDALVKRISDSFSNNMEQISCAGEVGIHKDEDFDQWSIEIRVKFR